MIRYTTGNLLEAQGDALGNTVHTQGVMGKGIALMFLVGVHPAAEQTDEARTCNSPPLTC